VILAAGVLKLPSLAGPAGAHIQGLVLLGAVLAGLASCVSVKWLTRYPKPVPSTGASQRLG